MGVEWNVSIPDVPGTQSILTLNQALKDGYLHNTLITQLINGFMRT